MPGFSPSEWVDEKLKAARELGHFVVLITSASSQLETCEHQRVVKLESWSQEDFLQECKEIADRTGTSPSRGTIWTFIGQLFDRVFRSLAGSRSDGRWSWAIPATFTIWSATIRFRPEVVFATGGPSAAQFAASLASLLPGGKRPVLEFQDPFIGREMALGTKVLGAMRVLNRFMMNRCRKYVTVSRGSMEQIKLDYPKFASKVVAIYPFAASRFDLSEPAFNNNVGNGKVELLHAGTLYGSRNLRPLFQALNTGYAEGRFSSSKLQITNLGSDYTGTEAREDYEELPMLPRDEALARASKAQVLLLVQHSDDRSLETIPFKLYDYLNLDVPILVLGRNQEIRNLLSDRDYFCNIEDQVSIVDAISDILKANLSNRTADNAKDGRIKRPPRDSYLESWLELIT